MMIRTSLDGAIMADVVERMSTPDQPARAGARQPVHTCYVPADRLTPDLPREWGEQALTALDEHGHLLDVPAEIVERVRAKLAGEPVEDLRIDFEDGYRVRGDDAEDADAVRAATLLAGWHRAGRAPPWAGIRFKSFDTKVLLERGVRTLDIFLTTLVGDLGAPRGLALTFPKVTSAGQVAALADLLDMLETRLGLAAGTVRFEIQIETTQSIVDHEGRLAVPGLIAAGAGRVSALHFGTYDYTAACGLDAVQQHLAHPACDFARHVMQVSAAGTGVWLSDGSTNVLPVGDAVEHGWRTHHALVRRALEHGFPQGWDLHPAQLVTRYAAVFGYYLQAVPESARRLRTYLSGATGSVADEPATARALARTLRRAVDCGALTASEVTGLVGSEEWRVHA
jgi:citrate lyase beta subunit